MGSPAFFVSELSPKVLVKVRYDLASCCRKNLPIPITTTENEDSCQPKGNKLDPKERDQTLCVWVCPRYIRVLVSICRCSATILWETGMYCWIHESGIRLTLTIRFRASPDIRNRFEIPHVLSKCFLKCENVDLGWPWRWAAQRAVSAYFGQKRIGR